MKVDESWKEWKAVGFFLKCGKMWERSRWEDVGKE